MVSSHNLKHAHVGTQSKISSFRCLGAHNAYGLGEGQLQQTVYCIDTICVFTHTNFDKDEDKRGRRQLEKKKNFIKGRNDSNYITSLYVIV
jgi:hypothetical protein